MTDDAAYLARLALVGPTPSYELEVWFPTRAAYHAWLNRHEHTRLRLVWTRYYYTIEAR